MRYEGASEAVADVKGIMAQSKQISRGSHGDFESYRRRQEAWQIQRDQAFDEINAIGAQMFALKVRQSAAQTELKRLKAQHKSIKKMSKFMESRFTQSTLYQWLIGQMASLYYQIYDIVAAHCLSVQACWQYELGDLETTFVQTDAWNDHYRGLLVGKTLQQNLQQMEAAYLTRHERRLEIVRTVSLADVLSAQTKYPSFADQKTTGQISFDLAEGLYDSDYPGHYMRQIKSIWITLPTLLGPYQDVKATLMQTRSNTLMNASVDGVNYLNGTSNSTNGAVIATNLRAGEQVALSSGLSDAGLFELRFDDERYLLLRGNRSGVELDIDVSKTRQVQDADSDVERADGRDCPRTLHRTGWRLCLHNSGRKDRRRLSPATDVRKITIKHGDLNEYSLPVWGP